MVHFINPTTARYTTTIANTQEASKKIFDSVTSGKKHDNSVVDIMLGTRVAASETLCRESVKQIATGINVLSTASSVLSDIKTQIEALKIEIVGLNNSDSCAQEAAQLNYVNTIDGIINTLRNTEFGGKKLFDGTSNIDGTPFNIQIGANLNDNLKITIENLLSWKADGATIVDKTTDGIDNPLFSVTDNQDLQVISRAVDDPHAQKTPSDVATAIVGLNNHAGAAYKAARAVGKAIEATVANNADSCRTEVKNAAQAVANGRMTCEINTALKAIDNAIDGVVTLTTPEEIAIAIAGLDVPAGANEVVRGIYEAVKATGRAIDLAINDPDDQSRASDCREAINRAAQAVANGSVSCGEINTALEAIDNAIDGVVTLTTPQEIATAIARLDVPAGANEVMDEIYEAVMDEIYKVVKATGSAIDLAIHDPDDQSRASGCREAINRAAVAVANTVNSVCNSCMPDKVYEINTDFAGFTTTATTEEMAAVLNSYIPDKIYEINAHLSGTICEINAHLAHLTTPEEIAIAIAGLDVPAGANEVVYGIYEVVKAVGSAIGAAIDNDQNNLYNYFNAISSAIQAVVNALVDSCMTNLINTDFAHLTTPEEIAIAIAGLDVPAGANEVVYGIYEVVKATGSAIDLAINDPDDQIKGYNYLNTRDKIYKAVHTIDNNNLKTVTQTANAFLLVINKAIFNTTTQEEIVRAIKALEIPAEASQLARTMYVAVKALVQSFPIRLESYPDTHCHSSIISEVKDIAGYDCKIIKEYNNIVLDCINHAIAHATTQEEIVNAIEALEIPAGANTVQREMYEAVKAATASLPAIVDNDQNRAKHCSREVKNAAKVALIANPAGDLTTNTGREQAIALMNSVSNKLTTLITRLTSQQNHLKQAATTLSAQIPELNDVANSYLNTDYEQAITAITEKQRKIKVTSFAQFLSEKQVNAIIDQLLQAAQTA